MEPKKIVCVDLDGTLITYDGWKGPDHFGDPRSGAVEFTKRLSEFATVVVYTTRTNCSDPSLQRDADDTPERLADRVRSWLTQHGFAFDSVYTGHGKPFCAAFVDDRNVSIPTNPTTIDFNNALEDVRRLL